MVSPIVSIIAPSNRPFLWKSFCKNIFEMNIIPCEIIFVGPEAPVCKLPKNFIHIKTNVKPAQCVEIAVRNSRGEFLLETCDDCRFFLNSIDNLYKEFIRNNNENIIITPNFWKKRKFLSKNRMLLIPGEIQSPFINIMGEFIKKSTWVKLGGIDNRFIAGLFQRDLCLRAYGIGGKIICCDNAIVTELLYSSKDSKNRLWSYTRKFDERLFWNLWTRKKKDNEKCPSDLLYCYFDKKNEIVLSKKRLQAVVPYKNKNLLEESEGNTYKKRWD